MKIRNHRKRTWWFNPRENSKLPKPTYQFKYKSSLMRFLNANIEDCIGGYVSLHEDYFQGFYTIREWFVWYNDKPHQKHQPLIKLELRQQPFRGHKYITKIHKVSKSGKKSFAFTDKIYRRMLLLDEQGSKPDKSVARNLVKLFYKSGFKDFEPNEETQEYIKSHIEEGIPFWYWSDRCNFVRMKTIIEYFKKLEII